MRGSLVRLLGVFLLFMSLAVESARGQDGITPRIINGTPTADFESVGIVGTKDLGGVGSGTLISPVHVLTAAHAAILADLPTDGTFELDGKVYATANIYVYPDYNPGTQANDIAIYELSEPVEGVTPSEIYRETPEVGQLLFLVGYGAGGNGNTGDDGTFGVRMVGTTTIDEVEETLILWRFDNNSEADTAAGDSGGPAFVSSDGAFLIAGVTSGGSDPNSVIGDVAFDTRVDAFADWIDSVVAGAEEPPPGNEEPPDDNGEQPSCPGQQGKHPVAGYHFGKHPFGGLFHFDGHRHPIGAWHFAGNRHPGKELVPHGGSHAASGQHFSPH